MTPAVFVQKKSAEIHLSLSSCSENWTRRQWKMPTPSPDLMRSNINCQAWLYFQPWTCSVDTGSSRFIQVIEARLLFLQDGLYEFTRIPLALWWAQTDGQVLQRTLLCHPLSWYVLGWDSASIIQRVASTAEGHKAINCQLARGTHVSIVLDNHVHCFVWNDKKAVAFINTVQRISGELGLQG